MHTVTSWYRSEKVEIEGEERGGGKGGGKGGVKGGGKGAEWRGEKKVFVCLMFYVLATSKVINRMGTDLEQCTLMATF